MSAREELDAKMAEAIRTGSMGTTEIVNAILAAGYRKPRIVPDAHLCSDSDGSYPVDHKAGTIVQSADGSVWRFDEGDWDNLEWGSASLRGPATVLFVPEDRS